MNVAGPDCLPISDSDSYDPFAIARALDWCAKWWWGASLILKLFAFVAGLSIILPLPPERISYIVAALTIVSELSSYRSDAIKSRAQSLRRKVDVQDSFGWQMAGAEFSDLLMRCPRSVKARARVDRSNDLYFASKEPPGPRRALQNISESAWWTKHLSEQMSHFCYAVLILSVIVALAVLIVALDTLDGSDTRASVARVITAGLMLLLSVGIVRLAVGYYGLSQDAGATEKAATTLVDSGKGDIVDAVKIMNEYHVARATGPIIPTWIWKLHRNELNSTWKRYRAKP